MMYDSPSAGVWAVEVTGALMRIDTMDKPWQLATLAAEFGPGCVRLAASWRRGWIEFVATALICGTLAGVGYAAIWSTFLPGNLFTYTMVSLPLVLYVVMTAYYVRSNRRPLVPLVEITFDGAPRVNSLVESAPINPSPGSRVESRFSAYSHRDPGSRFIRRMGETQLVAVSPDGSDEILLCFIEYQGSPDWSPQERLCRRINEALASGGAAHPLPQSVRG